MPHAMLARLNVLRTALSDASCSVTSPRLRVAAAHDVAVVAGLMVAELDGGCSIETCDPRVALAYLRQVQYEFSRLCVGCCRR